MSLKSWKEEFYPCAANSKEAQEKPVTHSLRKWKGALPENLKRHGMRNNSCGDICSSRRGIFCFDSDSCALCIASSEPYRVNCNLCHIKAATGNDCIDEFNRFVIEDDPKPMIELLEKTAKKFPDL